MNIFQKLLSFILFIFIPFLCFCAEIRTSITDPTALNLSQFERKKKILWITDTHLNSTNKDSFIKIIKNGQYDAFFITGDIVDGDLINTLQEIATNTPIPFYFVLGNSDNGYGALTNEVRAQLNTLEKEKPNIHYLYDKVIFFDTPNSSIKTAIVGTDGYADSWSVDITQRQSDLEIFEHNVHDAIKQGAKRIVILTHVPPFITDCWYKGEITSAKQAKNYSTSSSAMVFLNLAKEYPDITFIVYCGHTHNSSYQAYSDSPTPNKATNRKENLLVFVGNKFSEKGIYQLSFDFFLPEAFEYVRNGKTFIYPQIKK